MALDLDHLSSLLDAATPAPWREGSVERYHVFAQCRDPACLGTERVLLRMNTHFPHADDAALIAASRNALPALLRIARAARALRRTMTCASLADLFAAVDEA